LKYLVVVGDEPRHCAIYETESEEEVAIFEEMGCPYYEKPARWDLLSNEFWVAYERASNSNSREHAKSHFLARMATRKSGG